MTLTKIQLRRAARAARKLAFQCVAGTAPVLDWGWSDTSSCAVRRAAERASLPMNNGWERTIESLWGVPDDSDLREALACVAQANDLDGPWPGEAVEADRPNRVVFPLLALADALDEAAVTSGASAPKGPPGNLSEEL